MNQFRYQGKKTLEVLEGANNYNKWIAETILPFITPPILEIGSGIGNITGYFLSRKPIIITEIDDEFVKILKSKYGNKKDITIQKLDISKNPKKNLVNKFESIVAVNVLEHIKDDKNALKICLKMLKKNGKLIVLVPAKKTAYTKLDKELGHYRRYEKQELEEKLSSSGFTIKKIFYFNFLGLLSWIVRDKISKTHINLDPNQVNLFDKIVIIAKNVEKRISVPAGISLIAVAQKI